MREPARKQAFGISGNAASIMQKVFIGAAIYLSLSAACAPSETRVPGTSIQKLTQTSAQRRAPVSPAVRRIVVSIPDRKLALVENGRVVRVYHVAVGSPESPTPRGEYRIVRRLENPAYYHPGVVVPPGPANPLGPRWIGLDLKSFGIHGTNDPSSVGHFASHGCIRMWNSDVVELFALVREGDAVELHGSRDADVAAIFEEPVGVHPAESQAGAETGSAIMADSSSDEADRTKQTGGQHE